MNVLPLGILPLAVLWTLVCFGLGAWTMGAWRRIRRVDVASKLAAPAMPATAKPAEPAGAQRLGDYEDAVREVLADGVITQDEQVQLRAMRNEMGLSPADHVHAVARAQERPSKTSK